MTLENIIINYGYPAIFVGTFLEGETVLVLGGLAVHLGYLHMPGVAGAAFAGSLAGDQLAFHIGRRFGDRVLEHWPRMRQRIARVHRKTARFRSWIVLGFRFLYGLRNLIPFTLGMSPIPSGRFLVLNAAGAAVWALLVGGGGYLFGRAMEAFLGDARRYEMELMAAVGVTGLFLWLFHLVRERLQSS